MNKSACSVLTATVRGACYAAIVLACFAYGFAFSSLAQIPIAIGCVFVGFFVSALVHELGHAGVAMACGWRVIVFAVRPFAFHILNRNLVYLGRQTEPGAGGWVTAMPASPAKDTFRRRCLFSLGGPLASLLLGCAAVISGVTLMTDDNQHEPITGYLFYGLGLQALAACLLSLLPSDEGNLSDGDHLRMLKKSRDSYEHLSALTLLVGLLANKVRLRDLPEWMLDEARKKTSGLDAEASASVTRYLETLDVGRALDAQRVDAVLARQLIDEFRAIHGGSEWLDACDAYLSAVWEVDGERARTLLPQGQGLPGLRPLRSAAEAAVAARLGETVAAREHLRAMEDALRAQPPFRDMTFKDIALQIKAVMSGSDRAEAQPPERSSAGPPLRMKRLSQ